jgi:2-dehydro-3-deoxyphosphogluconate aldolase/(4S)-4-hydroxy-2-oxoglutarate aldolase
VGLDRVELEARLRAAGLIVVAKPAAPDSMATQVRTLLAAGVSVIEVTFRGDGAPAAIAHLRANVPGAVVGAGTVLTEQQARTALAAGAQFIVAPGSDPTIIDMVTEAGGLMIPGAATASEVSRNVSRGIRIQKLFPAEVIGGIPLLRAFRPVFRDVSFIPTGGIGPANFAAYLAEPNVLACGGSWLDDGSTGEALEVRAREAAAIVAMARGVMPA